MAAQGSGTGYGTGTGGAKTQKAPPTKQKK